MPVFVFTLLSRDYKKLKMKLLMVYTSSAHEDGLSKNKYPQVLVIKYVILFLLAFQRTVY